MPQDLSLVELAERLHNAYVTEGRKQGLTKIVDGVNLMVPYKELPKAARTAVNLMTYDLVVAKQVPAWAWESATPPPTATFRLG